MGQQPVLNLGLGLSALGSLAGRNCVREQPRGLVRLGGLESLLERRDVGVEEVRVGDQDVGRRGQILSQVLDNVVGPEGMVDDDVWLAQDRNRLGRCSRCFRHCWSLKGDAASDQFLSMRTGFAKDKKYKKRFLLEFSPSIQKLIGGQKFLVG